VTRTGVVRAWWCQSRRRFSSRVSLEHYQDARLQELLPFVRARSAFYRARLATDSPGGLLAMPPIDKAMMMAGFDQLNTCGVTYAEAMRVAVAAETSRDFTPRVAGLTVGLSSGTSGSRGLFLVSDQEREAWAGTILAKALPDRWLGWRAHRIAFFLRANSNLYDTLGSRRIRFEYFDLMQPLDGHLTRLQDVAPTVLVAPPAVLVGLASAVEAGRCAVQPLRVVSVADVLSPEDERRIRTVFRTTVHQVYQATEGLLATTCAFGTLHLAEDLVRFDREPLDADGRRFMPVVTDLCRTAQPIIRYRLDDILVTRECPCPCGSVLTALERIEGRADDVLMVRTVGPAPCVVYADFVRRAILLSSDRIRDYHVRQDADGAIDLWLDVAGEGPLGGERQDPAAIMSERSRASEAVRGLFVQAGATHVPVVRFVSRPALMPGQKRRRVERDPACVRGAS
jgi:putative adenylate-forming enzyme